MRPAPAATHKHYIYCNQVVHMQSIQYNFSIYACSDCMSPWINLQQAGDRHKIAVHAQPVDMN